MKNRIYLSPPFMGPSEKELLLEAFDSNWIAPFGPQVDQFEAEIAEYIGIKSAAALSSGTVALHLALKVLGLKADDKVLCSSLTFAASANAIMYENCVPVFTDSDPDTWNLDTELLENAIIKHRPKALIAVDLYGQSCDYDSIKELCKKYHVSIIEDAAEALGADCNGKKCGCFGQMGIPEPDFNLGINTLSHGAMTGQMLEGIEKILQKECPDWVLDLH